VAQKGRLSADDADVLAQGYITLDHQRVVEASVGRQGELTI
jgi:hypothetical protein